MRNKNTTTTKIVANELDKLFVLTDREPNEDEYKIDDLLYCKKCNTRKYWISDKTGKPMGDMHCACELAEHERAEIEAKKKQREKHCKELFINSMLGKRYRNNTFNNTVTGVNSQFDPAFSSCKLYCIYASENLVKGNGMYLYGSEGVGKTHLAACMINELTSQGYSCLITDLASAFNGMLKPRGFADSDKDKTRDLLNVDFLFLDDIGTEKMSDHRNEKLFEILNYRYSNKKCTIFTSNYSLRDLMNVRKYEKKVVDRIGALSDRDFEIIGPSWRLIERKNDKELKY